MCISYPEINHLILECVEIYLMKLFKCICIFIDINKWLLFSWCEIAIEYKVLFRKKYNKKYF